MRDSYRKNLEDAVFFEDSEVREEDRNLLQGQPQPFQSRAEKKFWFKMKQKVFGEFAPSADLLMSEHDNEEEIYIVRYYFHEFRIGRGLVNARTRENIYVDSFSDAMNADLFVLLDRHITLLEWLREKDFKGMDYEGNYALR